MPILARTDVPISSSKHRDSYSYRCRSTPFCLWDALFPSSTDSPILSFMRIIPSSAISDAFVLIGVTSTAVHSVLANTEAAYCWLLPGLNLDVSSSRQPSHSFLHVQKLSLRAREKHARFYNEVPGTVSALFVISPNVTLSSLPEGMSPFQTQGWCLLLIVYYHLHNRSVVALDFPGGASGKELACQCQET